VHDVDRGERSCPYWDYNSDPSAIQPVDNHYTDCAVLAMLCIHLKLEFFIYGLTVLSVAQNL
jgi:hypothetical protein